MNRRPLKRVPPKGQGGPLKGGEVYQDAGGWGVERREDFRFGDEVHSKKQTYERMWVGGTINWGVRSEGHRYEVGVGGKKGG